MTTPWGMIHARREAEEARHRVYELEKRIEDALHYLKMHEVEKAIEVLEGRQEKA